MQPDRRTTLVFGDSSRVPVGAQVVRNSEAELDGHRHFAGVANGGAHDLSQQVGLDGDRGAAAFARHFAYGTTEVHIDVVNATFADQAFYRLAHVVRIDPIQLEAARRFVGPEVGQAER